MPLGRLILGLSSRTIFPHFREEVVRVIMFSEVDVACRDCRHVAAEHDTVVGCHHAMVIDGERRFQCVCASYL